MSGGRLAGGRWVGGRWFPHYQCDFRYRIASGWCVWRLGGVFGGLRGQFAAFLSEHEYKAS